MGKTLQLLALCCATLGAPAHAGLATNPFDQAERIHAAAGADWIIDGGSLRKSSVNESGTYYHLALDKQSLRLLMTTTPGTASPRTFRALAIEDMKVDGRELPVFRWCLKNQEQHDRFLQQGLAVKQDICINDGEHGVFRVSLNHQTRVTLYDGYRLAFTIKLYRKPIEVIFDIADLADAFAILELDELKQQAAMLAAAAPARPAVKPAVVKVEQVAMCEAKAPAGFNTIKPVAYVCNDAADRARAENRINATVERERQSMTQRAMRQEQERQAEAVAAQQRRQQELKEQLAEQQRRQELERQQQAEAAAREASMEKSQALLNDITRKTLAVCNRLWESGKHRCYCEKFIEQAPADISSDASCAPGS